MYFIYTLRLLSGATLNQVSYCTWIHFWWTCLFKINSRFSPILL